MNFGTRFRPPEIKILLTVALGLLLLLSLDSTLPEQNWVLQGLLAAGCFGTAALICRLKAARQNRDESSARHYLEVLTRMDHHEIAEAAADSTLPTLHKNNPWLPLFLRARDRLIEYGDRADEAEHNWTSAEVRLRRLAGDFAQIEEVADGLPDPIVAINQYDELTWANRNAKHLFALQIDPASPAAVKEQLSCQPLVHLLVETRKRKSSANRASELEVTDAGGDSRWYRVHTRALRRESGEDGSENHGAVAVLTDISNERDTRKRHAEFVSAASHEMKTPLAGIRAYVELLLDDEAEDEAERDEFLSVIDTQADRLQRLIENLLNLARIEAGVEKVDKQPLSLNEVLESVVNVIQPAAEQKQIELASDLSPMFMGVLADRDLLSQCAINLLSNAIKYTGSGGKVILRSRMEENASVFEVEDTGVGLSEEDCAKVFQRFYRVKKDKQMAAGTGLGLPLAKHIAEDVHRGSLTVSSQLGKGSVFRVSLPSHARTMN